MRDYLNAISYFPADIKALLSAVGEELMPKINEIRIRKGSPIALNTKDDVFYCTKTGRVTVSYDSSLPVIDDKKMQEIIFSLSRRSVHTYQDMIAKGFIPLGHGCKAGVAGCAVMKNGAVYSLSSFNSINIRVSREYSGCSRFVTDKIGKDCTSYLIVGQPLSGKTTLLRDLCRFYSGENTLNPKRVAVIDERDEIVSKAFGEGLNVGIHTDVLSLYPKDVGVDIALRMLSPDIIVLDEIGSNDEIEAIVSGMNTGVSFIATAHGGSFCEVLKRPNIKKLVDSGVFKKAVVLTGKSAPGQVSEVIEL